MDVHIENSVGSRSRLSVNEAADVRVVQELLQTVAGFLNSSDYHPGPVDGRIGSDEKSSTVRAIRAFQRQFLRKPDGVIDPGELTWRRLMAVVKMGEVDSAVFPLQKSPPAHWHWTKGMRRFGAGRSKGRAHAGCDLYAPEGTPVYAVADGKVTRDPSYFYNGTYALEVDHGPFLVRYGEVRNGCRLRKGDSVQCGEKIAEVGHLLNITLPSDMLHIEFYDKTASGALTELNASRTARHQNNHPFLRRRDLTDPTPWLNRWQHRLPGA